MKQELTIIDESIAAMENAKVGRGFNNTFHNGRKNGLQQAIEILQEAKKEFISKQKAAAVLDFGSDFLQAVGRFNKSLVDLKHAVKKNYPSGGIIKESGPEIFADFSAPGERDKTTYAVFGKDYVSEISKENFDSLLKRSKQTPIHKGGEAIPDWVEKISNTCNEFSKVEVLESVIRTKDEQIAELKAGITEYIQDGRKQDVLINDLEQNVKFWVSDCKTKKLEINRLNEVISMQRVALKSRDIRVKILTDRLQIHETIEYNNERIIYKYKEIVESYESSKKFYFIAIVLSGVLGAFLMFVFNYLSA